MGVGIVGGIDSSSLTVADIVCADGALFRWTVLDEFIQSCNQAQPVPFGAVPRF